MNVKKQFLLFLGISLFISVMVTMVGASEGPVNINTATKEALMTLKYVGEALAERIIEYRNKHPFIMPEELMNVRGIGKKVFEANKKRIVCFVW